MPRTIMHDLSHVHALSSPQPAITPTLELCGISPSAVSLNSPRVVDEAPSPIEPTNGWPPSFGHYDRT